MFIQSKEFSNIIWLIYVPNMICCPWRDCQTKSNETEKRVIHFVLHMQLWLKWT